MDEMHVEVEGEGHQRNDCPHYSSKDITSKYREQPHCRSKSRPTIMRIT